MDRSPTAEYMFRNMARERGINIEIKSAGLYRPHQGRGEEMTKELGEWAERIYAMEFPQLEILNRDYNQLYEKMGLLGILGGYNFGDRQLEDALRPGLEKILEELHQNSAADQVPSSADLLE